MSKVINPLIGADIEVFLMHKDTRELVSAEGYIDGTKHEPLNFDASHPFHIISLDNVAAEFGIPPVTDKEAFFNHIMKSLEYIQSRVPEELCTVVTPAGIFHDRFLQTENARTFGCEPDFCVWTQTVNEKPCAINPETGEEIISPNLRSAGGHIHIGHEAGSNNQQLNELLVKAMDLYVGVPSVLQEPDNDRKKLYGKAGCFRFKEYGVEYRTISNYYAGDKRLTDWVFEATQRAIDAVNNDFPINDYGDRIMDAINNNNKVVAQTLINELQLEMA